MTSSRLLQEEERKRMSLALVKSGSSNEKTLDTGENLSLGR
jgi:hypothetical protein